MPDEVNSVVGSLSKTRGAGGIILWPLLSKNFRYLSRISLVVIVEANYNRKLFTIPQMCNIKKAMADRYSPEAVQAHYDSQVIRVKGLIEAAFRNEDILQCKAPLVISKADSKVPRTRHLFPSRDKDGDSELRAQQPATQLTYFVLGVTDKNSFISRYEIFPSAEVSYTIIFTPLGETTIEKTTSYNYVNGQKMEIASETVERETNIGDLSRFNKHEIRILTPEDHIREGLEDIKAGRFRQIHSAQDLLKD